MTPAATSQKSGGKGRCVPVINSSTAVRRKKKAAGRALKSPRILQRQKIGLVLQAGEIALCSIFFVSLCIVNFPFVRRCSTFRLKSAQESIWIASCALRKGWNDIRKMNCDNSVFQSRVLGGCNNFHSMNPQRRLSNPCRTPNYERTPSGILLRHSPRCHH